MANTDIRTKVPGVRNQLKAGQGRSTAEHQLQYQGKEFVVGDAWRLRLITTDEDMWCSYTARQVRICPSPGKSFGRNLPDIPGLPEGLVDHEGTPFLKCPAIRVTRVPVFVISKRVGSRKWEPVNQIKWIEFTGGLSGSLGRLFDEAAERGLMGYGIEGNDEFPVPMVDFTLEIQPNTATIPKKYEFVGSFEDNEGNQLEGVPLAERIEGLYEGDDFEADLAAVVAELKSHGFDVDEIVYALGANEPKDEDSAPKPFAKPAGILGRPNPSKVQAVEEEEEEDEEDSEDNPAPLSMTKRKGIFKAKG